MKITSPVGWLRLPGGAFLLLGVFCLVVTLCQPIDGAGSRSWMNLGSSYYLRGEYESAYGCFREALLLNQWKGEKQAVQRRCNCIWNLGLVCSKIERYEEAMCYFREIVRLGYAGESTIGKEEAVSAIKDTIRRAGGEVRIGKNCLR